MPEFSKLIAAIVFAAAAYAAARAYGEVLPPGTRLHVFLPVSAGVGLLCGWMIMGPMLGRGYVAALGGGMKTMICILAWVLLIFSIVLMVRKALRKLYKGPMEALVDIFGLGLEHLMLMGHPVFLFTLAVGAVLGGWLSEWAQHRWK